MGFNSPTSEGFPSFSSPSVLSLPFLFSSFHSPLFLTVFLRGCTQPSGRINVCRFAPLPPFSSLFFLYHRNSVMRAKLFPIHFMVLVAVFSLAFQSSANAQIDYISVSARRTTSSVVRFFVFVRFPSVCLGCPAATGLAAVR